MGQVETNMDHEETQEGACEGEEQRKEMKKKRRRSNTTLCRPNELRAPGLK